MVAAFATKMGVKMRKSARTLGYDYGLSAQEMNYVLKEKGFLEGDAGDYGVTEQGRPFAEEQDFHRGTGGYAQYNRYWTTRSWDEGIADVLDVTDEDKSAARAAVAATRKQQWDEIKTARAEADARFLASQQEDKEDEEESSYYSSGDSSDDDSDAAGLALIIGGLVVIGYGVYKATPVVINWWKTKVAPKLSKKKELAEERKHAKEMICPSCGKTMKLNTKSKIWTCKGCDYSISDADLQNEVFWFCDKCETFLNRQPGFNTDSGHWTCSECGFDNDVSAANIDED